MSGHTNNTENIALNGVQHSQAEAWYIEVLKLEQQGFAQTEQEAQARVICWSMHRIKTLRPQVPC